MTRAGTEPPGLADLADLALEVAREAADLVRERAAAGVTVVENPARIGEAAASWFRQARPADRTGSAGPRRPPRRTPAVTNAR